MEFLANLTDGMDSVTLPALLAAVFLAGLIEVIFPPFPGDATFIVSGVIAVRRVYPLPWVVIASCLGTFLAALILFLLGRIYGRPLLHKRFFLRLLPADQQGKIARWFARYGLLLILGSRFLPVVRSGIALAAGMADLQPARVLAALAGGIVVFNTLLVLGGAVIGDRWRILAARVSTLGWGALAILALVILALAVRARR